MISHMWSVFNLFQYVHLSICLWLVQFYNLMISHASFNTICCVEKIVSVDRLRRPTGRAHRGMSKTKCQNIQKLLYLFSILKETQQKQYLKYVVGAPHCAKSLECS